MSDFAYGIFAFVLQVLILWVNCILAYLQIWVTSIVLCVEHLDIVRNINNRIRTFTIEVNEAKKDKNIIVQFWYVQTRFALSFILKLSMVRLKSISSWIDNCSSFSDFTIFVVDIAFISSYITYFSLYQCHSTHVIIVLISHCVFLHNEVLRIKYTK
jgi:hypothetical protein